METESLSNFEDAEDGEIINDDPPDLYTPLERPHIPSVAKTKPLQSNESDDDDHILKDSSSDSDSSTNNSNSSKIRRKLLPCKTQPVKKKNYNIWCSDLQAEILTDNLIDCNVDQSNERVRHVESYNYKLGFTKDSNKTTSSYLSNESRNRNRFSGKRKHDGACVEHKMRHKNEPQSKSKQPTGNNRNILGLTTNASNSEDEIAKDIANKLCEEKEELILRALEIVGKEPVISLFEETRDIEANGGMLIMNGARRRTPGGVFFYLLKTTDSVPRDKINLVFSEDKKSTLQEKKRTAKETKRRNAAKFKEALSKDDFPTLLSRTELAIKEFKARKLADEAAEFKNPPPSPATDGRDCSSDGEEPKEGSGNIDEEKFSGEGRRLTAYDDVLFANEEDSMDVA